MTDTEGGERAPSFESLGLSPEACAAMERVGFPDPPGGLHSMILPWLISGEDLRGTLMHCENTRKRAAYLVTMFEKFKKHHAGGGGVRALILTATRYMASRTFQCAQKLFSSTNIVIVSLDGGENELERLGDQKPDAVIVTPDTLIHYLSAADGIMPLHTVELLVIDGAYEMLRLGFADHLNQILGQLPELDRQTLLFTTEMTAEVRALAKKILRRRPYFVRPSDTELMIANISSLALGVQEQPCVEQQHPNNLQGPCPPPTHCSDAKKKKTNTANKTKTTKMTKTMKKTKKKRAIHDGMEEAGRFKKRSKNSMDED